MLRILKQLKQYLQKDNKKLTDTKGIGKQLYGYVFRLGALAILSIIGLSIGLFLFAWGEFRTQLTDAKQQTAAIIADFIYTHESSLNVVGDFVSRASAEEVSDLLHLSLLRDREINGLYIIEKDGYISHEQYMPRTKLQDIWVKQPWAPILQQQQTYIDYIKRSSKPIPDLLMAVPIKNREGEYEKTLLAQIDLFPLWQKINRIRIGKKGLVYLVDSDGTIILHRTIRHLIQNSTLKILINSQPQDLKQGGLALKTDSDHSYALIASQKIPTLNWLVVSHLPLGEYLTPSLIFLSVLLGFITLAIFLAGKAEKFTRTEIVKPLNHLYEATKSFESGNFQHQVPSSGHYEFQALRNSFHAMGGQLHQTLLELNNNVDQLKLIAGVYDHACEGILIISPDGIIIETNLAFTTITGYRRDRAIGKNLRHIRPMQQRKGFYQKLWREVVEYGYWSGDIQAKHVNGQNFTISLTLSTIYNEQGNVQHYLGLFSDISERLAHEEKLEHIAHYDALTNLPNRLMLTEVLANRVAGQQPLAVVYLDLDGFKSINDTYGHEMGDKLLCEISQRLKGCLRQEDIIGRLGGDEFVAVLSELKPDDDELPLINRLLQAAATSLYIDGHKLQVSASLGVSFYPQDKACDGDTLLRQADHAMYEAKLAGRNQYHIFDSKQHHQIQDKNQDLERIRLALKEEEFVLFYQPKVNMKTGELHGAEALIRWQHPEKGLLPPAEFIPLIENNDLDVELSQWVINHALNQLEHWQKNGLKTKISVNLGGYHLLQKGFINDLQSALHKHPKVLEGSLEIEILESNALEDITAVSNVIEQCQSQHISVSLDDFGTGYSSLSYLKNLPVSQLKIDRSFIHDMMEDKNNRALVNSIISMAKAFNREVIAEGVETTDQGLLLIKMGCELGQGFGISKPVPGNQFLEWYKRWKPSPLWSQKIARL